MAVAKPCLKEEWEEWKRGMEEKRRTKWTEKVSYWANLEGSDNEEEEEEEEEEATGWEADEGEKEAVERAENEVWVKVKGSKEEGEVMEWEEGEDESNVIEAQLIGEEKNERLIDVKVEEMLIKTVENDDDDDDDDGDDDDDEGEWGDEEEYEEVGQTEEPDMAEQDQDRPQDQIEEGNRVAEPQTCVVELLQNDHKDPHVLEEDEETEVVNEVKLIYSEVHTHEEEQELEHIQENKLDQDEKGNKTDEVEVTVKLLEYDNEEEDCFRDTIDEEEQADQIPNQQNNENSLLEEEHKFTDEAEIIAGSPTVDLQDLEEEEESDEEEADDCNIFDDVLKTYCKEGYLCQIFGILKDFRDALLFTDLSLSAADGRNFQVHAPVLAAVSAHICENLRERAMENNRIHICLGPEVNGVGLEALVEFAYNGFISCLNEDTVHQIKTAAGILGACRVTQLCTEEEIRSAKTADRQKKESVQTEHHITLQAIKKMWMEKVGCDVILEAVGGSLHAHRVILAACSDYFRCMFTSGMRECRQTHVTLPSLLASELEALINCSYSGALPLSWSCVFEITSTALQLQHQPALHLCLEFMQREINPYFCLDVASFAEAYALAELLDVSHDYVLRQFQNVASTAKFKDLPAAQLLRYLHSHSLCVSSELVVFKAVVAWIQAKPKKRIELTKELMKTIHFPLMTYKEFKEVQSLKMWSDHGLEELYEVIFEDFCGSEAAPQSQYRTYLPKESLVVIGGDQSFDDLGSRRISRELWFANSIRQHAGIRKATEWRRLVEMPDQGRFRHEVAVLKGELYVFGGKKYYGTYDTLNSVYRYDPLQNSWNILPAMQEKRCSFSTVVLDGKIYAIGGHCDPNNIESVERYCPLANTWSYTTPLDLSLSAHAANVLHGQIFVSGGLDDGFQCLASMIVYHPQTGSTYLADMVNCRAQHCMEVLGERIYVAGGITMSESRAPLDLLACESYDPMADCWTEFSSLSVPHVGAGSAVLEGKFYLLGGYSQEDYSDTPIIHRYDPATQRWENTGKTPGPNNDIRVSVLSLPPNLRL